MNHATPSPSSGAFSSSAPHPMKKRLLLLTLAVGVGMAILNSFALQALFAYFVQDNIAFASVETAMQSAIHFLHIAAIFFGYAAMIYATFLFGERQSRAFFFASLIQSIAASLGSVGATFFSVTPRQFVLLLPSMLLYVLLNLLVYLVLLLLIRIATVLIKRRATRRLTEAASTEARAKGASDAKAQGQIDITLRGQLFSLRQPLLCAILAATGVYIASALCLSIAETVQLLCNYGLPVNMNEVITLISPYIETAAYFFIGYTVSLITLYLFQGQVRKHRDIA